MSPDRTSETEQSILNAARNVFMAKGLQGARMQEIADAAGINKALLHYYFHSKDQLFEKVFYEAIRTFFPAIQSILSSEKPMTEIIDEFVEFYISMLLDHPHLPVFLFYEMHHNQARLAEFVHHKGNPIQHFLTRVTAHIEEGSLKAVDPAQFFVSMISLCVFPFLGKPMLEIALSLDQKSFRVFMEDRKTNIKEQLKNMILL